MYVEKPFTVDAAEADDVFGLATLMDRSVCVGHDQLFDPVWRQLCELHHRGDLGDVVHIDSVMGYDLGGPFGRIFANEPDHWIHRLPGGLFHNNISHAVYKVTSFLTDERPRVQAAWFGDTLGRPTELRATIRGDRVTASLLFSSRIRPVRRVATIYGTRQTVEADLDSRLLRIDRPTTLPGPFARIQLAGRRLREATGGFARNLSRFVCRDLHYFAGMKRLFEDFYRSIRDGTEPPIPFKEIRRVGDHG